MERRRMTCGMAGNKDTTLARRTAAEISSSPATIAAAAYSLLHDGMHHGIGLNSATTGRN
jgi:hypothetical protein